MNAVAEQPYSVLIVDDHKENIDLLRRHLAQEPYRIAVAMSGEATLALAPKLMPDLILLDVMMPGIDGYETCRRLRADPATQAIPVIFVTAKTQPEDVVKGFDIGANDYICKPVFQAELIVRVRNQLQAAQARKLQYEKFRETYKLAELGHLVGELGHEVSGALGNVRMMTSSLESDVEVLNSQFESKSLKTSDLVHFLQRARESIAILQTNIVHANEVMQSCKVISVDRCATAAYPFEVLDYLQKILLSLRPRLKKTRVQTQLRCPASFTITNYPGALSQILFNLIQNSLIHGFDAQEEGLIIIDVQPTATGMTLTYEDTGKGIPEQHLAHIFTPYFTTKRGQGGSGIGLSIIRELIENQLGGQIVCESTEGKGVTFRITLANLASATQ